MKTKKFFIALTTIFLLLTLTIIVSAEVEPLPKGKCYWARKGYWNETGSRPSRIFEGVYGRFSNGKIKCFSPSSSRTREKEGVDKPTTITPEPTPEPEPNCWYKHKCWVKCKRVCGEWKCKKVCRRIRVCRN